MSLKHSVIASCLLLQSNVWVANDISPEVLVELNKYWVLIQQACLSSWISEDQCTIRLNQVAKRLRSVTDTYCESAYIYETKQECLDTEIIKKTKQNLDTILKIISGAEKQVL